MGVLTDGRLTQTSESPVNPGRFSMKSELWREGSVSSHHEDFKNRPVFKQLLVEVEDGSVENLFVFNNDRLSINEFSNI